MDNFLLQEIKNRTHKTKLITLVGGGGKTTTIYKLADSLKSNNSVLITTTTHMFHPHKQVDHVYFKELPNVNYQNTAIALFDVYNKEKDKVDGFSNGRIDRIKESHIVDYILNEGDGSRRKPLKCYGKNEPMIPMSSDIVIIVMGADAINKPLSEEVVHRLKEFKEATQIQEGDIITDDVIIKLLTHSKGFLKGIPKNATAYILFNKSKTYPLEFNQTLFADKLFSITDKYEAIIYAEMTSFEVLEVYQRSIYINKKVE